MEAMQNTENQPSMEMMTRIQQLKEAHAKDPGNYEVNKELANNYYDLQRFEKAIKYYQQALRIRDNDPNLLIDLGLAYFGSNRPDSAVHFVEKALQIQPDHRQGLYNLGIIFYNLEQPAKAIEFWQKLVNLHPVSEEARVAKDLIKQVQEQLNKS